MAATFDPTTAQAVTFNARNADAYEQVMGQWSRRLAPLLIRFGGLADGPSDREAVRFGHLNATPPIQP